MIVAINNYNISTAMIELLLVRSGTSSIEVVLHKWRRSAARAGRATRHDRRLGERLHKIQTQSPKCMRKIQES